MCADTPLPLPKGATKLLLTTISEQCKMAFTNTNQRYGGISKTFHWLTALLIVTLIPLGWYANQLPFETNEELARKVWFFSLHKTLGVTVFFVAVARILWALGQSKPKALNGDKRLEHFAAETVHWLLYGALVVVPLSGWISHAAASGFAPIWWPFGQDLPLVPKDTTIEHLFGTLHWIAARVLIASIALHVGGALKHLVIDRDATLARMLPGEAAIGPIPVQHASVAPIIAALAAWCFALGLAAFLSLSSQHEEDEVAELAVVTSDWIVQDGIIALGVVQFGNEVTGGFADWTADITFDPDIPIGKAGSTTVQISIPSLSLGSVSQQAMGADFFDAENHPTATFTADLLHASDQFKAVGTLELKGNSVPVTLPFSLSIRDDVAQMDGRLKLDRRDFGIGDNMADEQNLNFAVTVKISLTAIRAPRE
jgi:cytochrome b561/polyisoprenoid-binding protein YceI